jgi:hypothetical protein
MLKLSGRWQGPVAYSAERYPEMRTALDPIWQ